MAKTYGVINVFEDLVAAKDRLETTHREADRAIAEAKANLKTAETRAILVMRHNCTRRFLAIGHVFVNTTVCGIPQVLITPDEGFPRVSDMRYPTQEEYYALMAEMDGSLRAMETPEVADP